MLHVLLHKVPNALLLPLLKIYGNSEKFIDASTTARASTYIKNHLVDGEMGLRQGSDVEAYSKIIGLRVFNRIFVNCHAEGFELLNQMTANGGHFLKKLKGQQKDKRVKALVEKKDFIEYFDSSMDQLGGLTGLEVWNSLLDPDDSGILTSKKCITQIRRISEARKNTMIGMQDTDMVIRSLDFAIATGFNIFVALIGIGVLGIDVSSAWTMITSVVLSLTFIFGSSAADSFRSIVFLFAMTPYNVGDTVQILDLSPDNMVVERIFLLTSVFHRWDGSSIVVTNVRLMSMTIQNVTLSSKFFSLNVVHVDGASFPPALVEKYREDMEIFLKDRKILFSGSFGLTIRAIDDNLKFKVILGLEHNVSVMDMETINRGKTEAMGVLMQWFVRDRITYSDPERCINALMESKKN